MGRNNYPTAEFSVTYTEKKYNGKVQKSFVGSFINESGEKVLITIGEKPYKSKNGKTFKYARAINLGHESQAKTRRNQMG